MEAETRKPRIAFAVLISGCSLFSLDKVQCADEERSLHLDGTEGKPKVCDSMPGEVQRCPPSLDVHEFTRSCPAFETEINVLM
jgi:hypothetical protein